MHQHRLCLGATKGIDPDIPAQINLMKQVGFDGFFTCWEEGSSTGTARALADALGMEYQSIHAPFGQAAKLWLPPNQARSSVEELLRCLADCERYHVPLMVMHCFIGFHAHSPNPYGIENVRRVVEAAKAANIRIALENTEGEAHLELLLREFQSYGNVGFCWDTGHEMCYNHSQDMLSKYGELLFATHLNDNLGIQDAEGRITCEDDLHLLPFDGIADWPHIARRLRRHNYHGMLTFELKRHSHRLEAEPYCRMSLPDYIAEAYNRACRFAALLDRFDGCD